MEELKVIQVDGMAIGGVFLIILGISIYYYRKKYPVFSDRILDEMDEKFMMGSFQYRPYSGIFTAVIGVILILMSIS